MSRLVDRVQRMERAVRETMGLLHYYVSDSPDGGEELSPVMTEEEWEAAFCRPQADTSHLRDRRRARQAGQCTYRT